MVNAVGGVSSSTQSYSSSPGGLEHFKKKYGSLNFESKPFSSIDQAFKQGRKMGAGFNNVLIDPKALKKMKKDPEFAKKIEETIDALKGRLSSSPIHLGDGPQPTSSGIVIDENGGLCGGWYGYPGQDAEEGEKIEEETVVVSEAKTITEMLEELRKKVSEQMHSTMAKSMDTLELSYRVEIDEKIRDDSARVEKEKVTSQEEVPKEKLSNLYG